MKTEHTPLMIDLYAGQELPEDLADELEVAAFGDAALSHEMSGLRRIVEELRRPESLYTEESRMRILRRLSAQGVELETPGSEPRHYQYALPING